MRACGGPLSIVFLFFPHDMDVVDLTSSSQDATPPPKPTTLKMKKTSTAAAKKKSSSSPTTTSTTGIAPPNGPLKGMVFALAGGTVVPKMCFHAWSQFVHRQGGRLIHAADAKLDVTDGGAVTHGKEEREGGEEREIEGGGGRGGGGGRRRRREGRGGGGGGKGERRRRRSKKKSKKRKGRRGWFELSPVASDGGGIFNKHSGLARRERERKREILYYTVLFRILGGLRVLSAKSTLLVTPTTDDKMLAAGRKCQGEKKKKKKQDGKKKKKKKNLFVFPENRSRFH